VILAGPSTTLNRRMSPVRPVAPFMIWVHGGAGQTFRAAQLGQSAVIARCYWADLRCPYLRASEAVYASFSHFSMKLFLAAPANAFPFLSIAFAEQASRLHF
jgi:hypothetical protein